MTIRKKKLDCIHISTAKKFLNNYIRLSEENFCSEYDICYNRQCNNGIIKEKSKYGIPRKECDTPIGFVGVGLRQSNYLPLELQKVFATSKNESRHVEDNKELCLDDELGDFGEPTYREIDISNEDKRVAVRNVFNNNISTILDEKCESICNSKNKILEWYRLNCPVWNESDHVIMSGIFKSTPDWKRLFYYKNRLCCEWGSAVVVLLIQFWQTSLSYTDLIVNNRDFSIVEYIGGSEESCIPLRILVKFERKNFNVDSNIGTVISVKKDQTSEKRRISVHKSFRNSGEQYYDDKNNGHEYNEPEHLNEYQQDNNIILNFCDKGNFRYLEMVRYINLRDLPNEFRHLESKFKGNLEKDICRLYMDHPNDFQLKFQCKYDKDVIKLIKSCIKGRKYDNDEKLWTFPIETIYESVMMVDFLGGKINDVVLSLLVNGNKEKHLNSSENDASFSELSSLFCPENELVEKWKGYFPKVSKNTWFRYKIRFHIENIFNIDNIVKVESVKSNRNKISEDKMFYYYLDLNSGGDSDNYQKDIILRIFRNNNIDIKWDDKEERWRLKIEQFNRAISILRENLEYYFSNILDGLVYKKLEKNTKNKNYQTKTTSIEEDRLKLFSYKIGKSGGTSLMKSRFETKDCNKEENECSDNYQVKSFNKASNVKKIRVESSSDDESDLYENDINYDDLDIFSQRKQVIILSCLGKDEYDNIRLKNKIEKMINEIRIPEQFDRIEFIMWPKHYKEWESISFLIISKDLKLNNYHPKLLLSLISNVMVVKENMIDYIVQKNTWPDNSFETRFEVINGIPSLESRLYISEGIFCKTKLFIAGNPNCNHFKLCTRLATLGNASFVQNPLLADYIVICDERDSAAIEIKKSVPKKQATKVQNTHGETHSIQVTPKWVYDVILDFSIIKPTSKRNHKAWISECS
ncbi:hypothetical protein FG386_000970 [Cryptosporidium ryanae]|uniref:uncharacterized protein n=1 Tax=Cryptosporidium ryanae TaxID=515981 RepID=UPI00351A1FDC|nr:hypothetical protein FG386_000970 [Cryptosporidium ryanae]